MAQIRTINGERFNVKETKSEIDYLISNWELLGGVVLTLQWQVTISGSKKGKPTEEKRFEPVSFMISNIMMYY